MGGHTIRPSIAKVQNAQKMFTSTKTNATIRDLEEEEGELEEKEGTVVSIQRDNINGTGWTVKDKEGQIYKCSCASSMYELPESVERGGMLYPKDTITVTFTVNPILRINTIKEITSLGEETEKLDISKWQHKDESTTVIAKPKSALSISDGFIQLNYDNDNKVLANKDAVKTQGKKTVIDTNKLSINSKDIDIGGISLSDLISTNALDISNEYDSFGMDDSPMDIIIDRTNNITQLHITGTIKDQPIVVGQLKDQKLIPIRKQSQQLMTDGNCVDRIVIDTNGIITIEPVNNCKQERNVDSTHNWITPQTQSRNYIKTAVKQTCDACSEGINTYAEYINYCPKCQSWNMLSDTGTSIRCSSCQTTYCQNCGIQINGDLYLKKYTDNNIVVMGTTCKHCSAQLDSGTTKSFVNYCPDCRTWNELYHSELIETGEVISILRCGHCDAEYCATCGINQNKYGITLTDKTKHVTLEDYNKAFRKLKYIRDGA